MLSSIEKLGGSGLANQINQYNQYTGDPGYLPQDLERLRRVTPADVQRAARAWLQQRARVVVTGVPGVPDLGPEVPGAPAPAQKTARSAGVNPDQAWRNKPPKAGPPPRFTLPAGESFRLANGLTVIHHYNPALPLVSADLVIRSGSDANPGDAPGLAGFTAQMLEEGTATRSAPQIADEIAQLGAFLDSGSSTDASTVSLLSLKPAFAQALDVLADVVQHPAFPTAEVERQRASRLGDLSAQREDPEAVAAVAAAGALYGPRHPYGYGQLGTEPAIREVTRDDLQRFWRRHYVPDNAALVVSGDISRAELKALAEARFGGWERAEPAQAAPGSPATTTAHLVVVDKPGAPQTALRVTAVAAARSTPDYPALQVMNAALGGLFSSRLNQVLREEKGYSYGVSSQFRYNRTPGPFIIAGSVRTDATGASVAAILDQVQGMRERPLGAAELAGARNSQVLSLPDQFETNEGIGNSLADTFVYGLPLDYYSRLPAQFERVTAQEAQAAARKYLAPERMVVVAVGDRARIAPQLDALKLGASELRDTDGQRLR
jgi:zinc protease